MQEACEMARTRSPSRLWALVGALCMTPPAEAAQQRSSYSGYQCLLLNGAKFFAMEDVSQHFPQAVQRCSRVRVPTPWRAAEGKEPRIVQDYVEVPAVEPEPEPDLADAEEVPVVRTPGAIARNETFKKLIVEASWRHELDPELVQAVIHVESAYQPQARSPKGAMGLMQVMPATGARYGVSEPRQLLDPAMNIEVGTRYLRDLHKMFKGRTDLILAAYNAGEGAVARYGNRIPPYPETREYVRRALKIYRGDRR
jgi:soluble lytic murein transglycosylase-like protein